jgi:uncharacterized protein YecE (DUF72 family)
MGQIRVGSASWADPELVKSGLFYPKEAKSPEERLRFYASKFSLVEVDSSYYAMPSSTNSQKWADRTPDDFLFNMKAFRLFTRHQTDRKMLPADIRKALPARTKKMFYYEDVPEELRAELWRQFKIALEPLRRAGKLVAVHFQFPKWFVGNPRDFAHLEEIRERMADYLVAVEFRARTWFDGKRDERTLEMERRNGWVNVTVDEPDTGASSIPTVWDVTSPRLAIVRMHGRNHGQWDKKELKTSAERFDYDYTDDELAAFVKPIKKLAKQVDLVQVIMNNNRGDQGVRNGATLRDLLGAR